MVLFVVGAKALLAATTIAGFLADFPNQAFAFSSPAVINQHRRTPHEHNRRWEVTTNRRTVPRTIRESQATKESDAELIHDIEVMEDEAKHRLHNLLEQMDELQSFQTTTTTAHDQQQQHHSTTEQDSAIMSKQNTVTRTESKEKTATTTTTTPRATSTTPLTPRVRDAGPSARTTLQGAAPEKARLLQQPPRKQEEVAIVRPRPLDLLGDTSWKIVLNIGREEGTWMPPAWGKSGGRLRVEVHCTFSTAVVPNCKDPFFAHSSEPVRAIEIIEAFVWPTNIGVGRRPLAMTDPNAGRYQICPGVGPAGTDLLRLMIPIPDDLQKDDVTLNAGRVYGTTGYFGHPEEGRSQILTAVQDEYDRCVAACDKLQRELTSSSTEHNFMDWVKLRHAIWTADRALDRATARVTLAGQHYPDHAHLRTDSTGRVGLAKEGGLCVAVHTGLAMEYHILGRMEVGHLVKRINTNE
jgi:hypothetical protein